MDKAQINWDTTRAALHNLVASEMDAFMESVMAKMTKEYVTEYAKKMHGDWVDFEQFDEKHVEQFKAEFTKEIMTVYSVQLKEEDAAIKDALLGMEEPDYEADRGDYMYHNRGE